MSLPKPLLAPVTTTTLLLIFSILSLAHLTGQGGYIQTCMSLAKGK
ncbi:exported hypothetical protein [Mesorhizobium metallidurans STM 2683]|uniref:Uncharacterized protein n=1 Tax=Mesorhizobium metallidurans STM 2683 TaxID=1297569 RepID=M5EG59_9HYPH|nr:exported hypothetical protein [Mesorhizobium metallidurans STM 2683]